ncbi:MAG: hypothetical protein ACLQFR_12085 [Streptosporangiaceae bacterium]
MSSAPERSTGYEGGVQGSGAQPTTRATRYPEYETGQYEGTGGSTALAAWLMILGGLWSFFLGLAIVVKKSYFTSLPSYSSAAHTYAYHWNIGAWGWANLILGIVVVAAGVCVLLGQEWARWTGIVLVVISALGTFLFLPFYPFWSIIIIAVDVFIIWALATARQRRDIA